jgi:C4-type Zn-finger protein
MKNHYCSSEICKTPLKERMTEITIRLFDQIGESLLSQHYLIETQSKKMKNSMN